MRVGIYVPDVTPEWGGAYTLVRDLLSGLAEATTAHEVMLLHAGEHPPVNDPRLPSRRVEWEPFDSPAGRLDAAVRAAELELVWFPTPHFQPVGVPFVVTVWDLEHRNQPFFPEVVSGDWPWAERERFYTSVVPRATLVVTGTDEGRRQIHDYYRVPESRIVVAALPAPQFTVEELAAPDSRSLGLDLPEPYVLYPAQLWPHKNHVLLLRALAALGASGERIGAVFCGGDRGNREHLDATCTELGLDDSVRRLGFVDRRTLVSLYRGALALAFPSFFGPDNLPPLEAFALGCPVAAAAVPGAAALYGQAAILFDPRDERELTDALRSLLRDAALRERLVAAGSAISQRRTPAEYVRRVVDRFDDFARIRRCWSRRNRDVHS